MQTCACTYSLYSTHTHTNTHHYHIHTQHHPQQSSSSNTAGEGELRANLTPDEAASLLELLKQQEDAVETGACVCVYFMMVYNGVLSCEAVRMYCVDIHHVCVANVLHKSTMCIGK